VSQHVGQGTVAPTSYNIIHNSSQLNKDKLEILTYKFTHLYYNWSGTTRIPAVSQYAKKLAFLTSQSLSTSVHDNLVRTLYFL
jgi:aubergine